MDTCTLKIREYAFNLLENKEVEAVIGFEQGTFPMSARPVAIRTKEDTGKLVFNSLCGLNLANYTRKLKGKIAVTAKGCDSRNIVNHIVENQMDRDRIIIIGVPCTGMVDQSKLAGLFKQDIVFFDEKEGMITVKTASEEKVFAKTDMLRENCSLCMHRNPVIYDYLAGEPVQEQTLEDPFADVRRIENMPPKEKQALFEDLTRNCIRCYACRNACPLCYCPTCFVDESNPQWVGKSQNKTDVDTFHFLRAFHCAGRCTDCGACVEACPMDINVRLFTRKLIKDSYEMFNWEAGLDIKKRPPLDTFAPDDPDDFIK